MENQIAVSKMLERLPSQLKTAQEAIALPEVQEMIEKLAAYNLGVFMPHQHNELNGDFEVLPEGLVQIENDLQVSFLPASAANELTAIPVGWIWRKDGVRASAECVAKCTLTITPGGNPFHIDNHKGGGS